MGTYATTVLVAKGASKEEIEKLGAVIDTYMKRYEDNSDTWAEDIKLEINNYYKNAGEDQAYRGIVGDCLEVEYFDTKDVYLVCGINSKNSTLLELIHYLIDRNKLSIEIFVMFDTDNYDTISCDHAIYVGGEIQSDTYMDLEYDLFYYEQDKYAILRNYLKDKVGFLVEVPTEISKAFNNHYLFLDI